MFEHGQMVIYKPINWVNNQSKTDSALYGKTAKIVGFGKASNSCEPIYYIRVSGEARVMYAYHKELEEIV